MSGERSALLVGLLALAAPAACGPTSPGAADGGETSDATGGTDAYRGPPMEILGGLSNPFDIALDEGYVYWTGGASDDTAIRRVAKDGSGVEAIAPGEAGAGIAVRDGEVYWADFEGAIRKVSAQGGEVTTLATVFGRPFDVAVDDQHVYWTNWDVGIERVSRSGGSVEVVFLGSEHPDDFDQPYGIALDASSVYWSDVRLGAVLRADKETLASPETLAVSQGSPYFLAVDGSNLYWTALLDDRVRSVPKEGGPAVALAAAPAGPIGVAVHDQWVYYTATGPPGDVGSVPLGGGSPVEIETDLPMPWAIAVDESGVFWANRGDPPDYSGGALLRAAH